ncbi:MAG: SDR family oxidoreductase [Proteobacteria bacterium]|jgi:short-subunit dehydrogenase|nr:SDR family oxidoreductase [Pseudomonadota bacterium]
MSEAVAITGVLGGIGLALAREFQSRGYQVIGLDLREECEHEFAYFQLDVTDRVECEKTFQQIRTHYPKLRYWINNAGIAHLAPFLDSSVESFDKVMAVNFTAAVFSTHYWLTHFKAYGGVVVNISSAAGFIPNGDMSSYVASKHALVGFTRAVQMELDFQQSLASTCLVTPGFVKTEIMQVGSKYGLPTKLSSFATPPEKCAREIVEGVLKGEKEIVPTVSGKVMTSLYHYMPFGSKLSGLVYKASKKLR